MKYHDTELKPLQRLPDDGQAPPRSRSIDSPPWWKTAGKAMLGAMPGRPCAALAVLLHQPSCWLAWEPCHARQIMESVTLHPSVVA